MDHRESQAGPGQARPLSAATPEDVFVMCETNGFPNGISNWPFAEHSESVMRMRGDCIRSGPGPSMLIIFLQSCLAVVGLVLAFYKFWRPT